MDCTRDDGCERKAGGQKKRHKIHIKTVLKNFKVAPEILYTYAAHRSGWRMKCHKRDKKWHQTRSVLMRLRRRRRHHQDLNVADGRFPLNNIRQGLSPISASEEMELSLSHPTDHQKQSKFD